jgi:predicted DNA-binding protein with PD1-like motif
VRPNVDLVRAVEALAVEHGLRRAIVRGKIGSLVGACLQQGDYTVRAPGPATEVMFLDGWVTTERGSAQAQLSAAVVDLTGTVYLGRLVPGRNPVAMTFELALTESWQDG